jgi:hypothetical protein
MSQHLPVFFFPRKNEGKYMHIPVNSDIDQSRFYLLFLQEYIIVKGYYIDFILSKNYQEKNLIKVAQKFVRYSLKIILDIVQDSIVVDLM